MSKILNHPNSRPATRLEGRYKNMVEKRHELLEGVVTHTIKQLVDLGIPPESADLCANSLADMLSDVWGGQTFAMPMDYDRKLSIKELEAWDYNQTHNIAETAKHFGMGERGMHKLLHRMRQRIKKQRLGNEPALF